MTVHHWLDDDAGYQAWKHANPEGYVANINKRIPINTKYLKIHRASHVLPDRSSPDSLNPWTGNNYAKVTSTSLKSVLDWARQHGFDVGPRHYCKTCSPSGTDSS